MRELLRIPGPVGSPPGFAAYGACLRGPDALWYGLGKAELPLPTRMVARRAAQLGAAAVLLEKGPKVDRKLRISGKGRGNITNTAPLPHFIKAFSPNGRPATQ